MDDFFKFWIDYIFSKKERVDSKLAKIGLGPITFTYSSGFLSRPEKCAEEISKLIWYLLGKIQINWAITSDLCGPFRKPELFLLSKFCDLLFPNFIIHFLQQPPRSSPPFSVMIPPLPRAPISPPPMMSMLTTTVTSSKSPKGSSGFSIDNIIGNERTKENSSSSPTPIQVRSHFDPKKSSDFTH